HRPAVRPIYFGVGEPMPPELQLADDVGAEAGENLLGDGGSADDRASFEDQDRAASAREVRSGGESVVTASDDNGVEAHPGHYSETPALVRPYFAETRRTGGMPPSQIVRTRT